MSTSPRTITLLINNSTVEFPWQHFVNTLEATDTVQHLYNRIDSAFVLQCAGLVFFMQAGFLMVETGSVSNPNKVKNILLKNIGDISFCALMYYLIGFGLAFGEGGPFIGTSGFAGYGPPFCMTKDDVTMCEGRQYTFLVFQLTFATSASTIMSGAIAERMRLLTYYVISCVLSCFLYPIASRWIWSPHGWASVHHTDGNKFLGTGALDYAGSSTVHLLGAAPALILLPLLGPRRGRFEGDAKRVRLPGQNNYFTTIGTMLLWFSWYGFVCGSTGGISGSRGSVVAKIAVNSTLSAAFSSLSTIVWGLLYEKKVDSMNANNGVLAGLVAISASCATCDTEAAVFIGIIGSGVYFGASKMLVRAKLDDVVDALAIHGGCGWWGIVAAGIFSTRDNIQMAYPHYTNVTEIPCGALYVCDGLGIRLLTANVIYSLCLLAWVLLPMTLLILPLWYFNLLHSERINESDKDYGKHASGILEGPEEEEEHLPTIEEASEAQAADNAAILPRIGLDDKAHSRKESAGFTVENQYTDQPPITMPNISIELSTPSVSISSSVQNFDKVKEK